MTDVQATNDQTTEQPVTTALTNPKDYNTVHPLNSPWVLWFDNPNRRTNVVTWKEHLKHIVTVKTVEDFWGVYNKIPSPLDLPHGSNYHLFREGIEPMWEDKANKNGGKWACVLQRSIGEKVNEHWLHTLLACIGETFETSPEVCGVVFSNRKSCFKINLWTRTASNKTVCEDIGRHLKSVMGINGSLDYFLHDSVPKSENKPLYTV
ncbi:eukaryotic translation initiation factor 4E [Coemansia sp. RSA 2336]|nr:eukaryotic translation initiation factor 4E [Coemansia sp. RSA 2336]